MIVRIVLSAVLVCGVLLVFVGSPLVERGERAARYSSAAPILPMTFAHADHQTIVCLECHHNFVDDTGDENCMTCHVTHPEVAHLLEEQFHGLCMGCHQTLTREGEASGPVRACAGCHLPDELP